MTVYVVYYADYDDYMLLAIFSSKEKAESYIKSLYDDAHIFIDEMVVDKLPENYI